MSKLGATAPLAPTTGTDARVAALEEEVKGLKAALEEKNAALESRLQSLETLEMLVRGLRQQQEQLQQLQQQLQRQLQHQSSHPRAPGQRDYYK